MELNNQLILLLSPSVERTPSLSRAWLQKESALADRTISQVGLPSRNDGSRKQRSRRSFSKLGNLFHCSTKEVHGEPGVARGRRPSTFGEIFTSEGHYSPNPSRSLRLTSSESISSYRISEIQKPQLEEQKNMRSSSELHHGISCQSFEVQDVDSVGSPNSETVPADEDALDVKTRGFLTRAPAPIDILAPLPKEALSSPTVANMLAPRPKDVTPIEPRSATQLQENQYLCPDCGENLLRKALPTDRSRLAATLRKQGCSKCKSIGVNGEDKLVCQDCGKCFCKSCCRTRPNSRTFPSERTSPKAND
mmetsp:Transcript_119978/g.187387  ORF Transcript_119978/g.187387 Transcript_119978/m.187387 type:complete len:307 (-) Transcript_119978:7-927(-)